MIRAHYKQIDRTKAPPDNVVIEYDVDVVGSAGNGLALVVRVRDKKFLELPVESLKQVV